MPGPQQQFGSRGPIRVFFDDIDAHQAIVEKLLVQLRQVGTWIVIGNNLWGKKYLMPSLTNTPIQLGIFGYMNVLFKKTNFF